MRLLTFCLLSIFCIETVSLAFEFTSLNQSAHFETLEPAIQVYSKAQTVFPNPNSSVRCGSVATGSNGGGIFYKPFELVIENERCVWTIAAPNATGYSINVLFLGNPTNQPESGQELIITGIQGKNMSSPELTSVRPTTLGTLELMNVNILLVTFISASYEGISNGFVLEYIEILGSENATSSLSTHHLFNTKLFEFQYPVENANPDINELSTFVFSPQNNVRTGAGSLLWYKVQGEGSQCEQQGRIAFYRFNASNLPSVNPWIFKFAACTTQFYEVLHDDIILVLFHSTITSISKGFWLYYSNCPLI